VSQAHNAPTTQTVIVMPAYNAERTLARIVSEIPPGCADEIIVVDDCSDDRTAEIAADLPVSLIRHETNRGYGGNQKTCYDAALERGASYVVMLHPDAQYDARLIPVAVEVLRLELCDIVLGNRIRTRAEALAGGMPPAKYLANRFLTLAQNLLTGQNLGEWHSGFRAYRREALERIPYDRNSDGFVFDSQLLLQSVHLGLKLGDIPIPVRYFEEASSIGPAAASAYAIKTLWALIRWHGHRLRVWPCALFKTR